MDHFIEFKLVSRKVEISVDVTCGRTYGIVVLEFPKISLESLEFRTCFKIIIKIHVETQATKF